MSDEIYVVVVDNDQYHKMPSGREFYDDGGPLIMEQYTRSADFESIRARAKQLGGKFGRVRIARLQFLDEEES